MKKHVNVVLMIAALFFLTSCASSMPVGGLYTQVKLPVTATGVDASRAKVGTAECTSILGLIAIGDASIETARHNGKISKITHVDWDAMNILGIIGTYKVTVYGQ